MADIELVVKIDEEIYTHFCQRYKYQDTNDIGLSESTKVGVAIKNGTLLPKGHGDLIDRNDLLRKHPEFDTYPFPSTTINNAKPIIEADDEGVQKLKVDKSNKNKGIERG